MVDDTTERESTATLLRRVQSGDESARSRLCALYLPVLRRWAQGQMPRDKRDLVDTNDLTQITLMRVLSQVHQFESRHEGAFLCYLRETLMNAMRDEIRRSIRRGGGAKEDLEVLDWNTEISQAVGAETVLEYEQALARLEPSDREAVLLRFEFGFSFAEIAAAMEKPSPDAARMSVKRALAELAEQLT